LLQPLLKYVEVMQRGKLNPRTQYVKALYVLADRAAAKISGMIAGLEVGDR